MATDITGTSLGEDVRLLRVGIACPSDVRDEVADIFNLIHDWNSDNSDSEKVVLIPKHWSRNSYPILDGEAQSIINYQIIDRLDILIAIFQNKIGTPTINSQSGTVEEITRVYESGKPVLVYFSEKPIDPRLVESQEFRSSRDSLARFRNELYSLGIVDTYSTDSQLLEKLEQALKFHVRELKIKSFAFSSRIPRIKKYDNIKEVGQLSNDNLQEILYKLFHYVLQSRLHKKSFQSSLRRVDLVRIYQVILHKIGIKFHYVNSDVTFERVYRDLIDSHIISQPPDGHIGASYNYCSLITKNPAKSLSKIRRNTTGAADKTKAYYGFSINENLNQYESTLQILSKRGFNVDILEEIGSLVDRDGELFLSLPDEVINDIFNLNPEEFKRQNSYLNKSAP